MIGQDDDRTVAINNTNNMVGRELDGRYRILERLGSGGMGTVFKALHLKLGRPVALKILHPHLIVDSKILSRFENEINVMSALGHPNLITIQDAGKTDEGIPYFVMEYLECDSLSDRLKDGRIEASRAVPIFVQIADALQHAHEKGVIHRDLKPANVLLIKGSEAGGDFVKVVDLGIAKVLGAGDMSAQKQLTQTGEVFGSPQYMAPEQCLGKAQDARTDVYAFGCLMFEVLCGAPPIVRETALETIFAHVNDSPMTFEEAGLAGDKECDRLERIVMRCLAKAPEDRFASMAEVLAALNDRRSVHPPPPPSRPLSVEVAKPGSSPSPPREGASRGQGRDFKPMIILSSLAVVGLLLLVALAGLGLAWTQLQRSPAAPPDTSFSAKNVPGVPVMPAPPFNPGRETVIEFEKVAGESAAVKVVSEYNGKPTGEFVDLIKGETEVDIGYSEEPVILVVNAYQPTTWTIKRRNPSVRIKKVLAVGYYPQTVRGVPDSLVESVYYEFLNADSSRSDSRTHENPFDFFYFLFSAGDSPEKDSEFKKMKECLYQHTGCHIRTFKGTRSTDRFEID
ncbi:MAG: serine/threonine protein kinase [Candidatus Melainabacteria bacterium]|nr:serine/threonine protein kinase [Candidatus Melainabacteria bacterium]